MREKLGSGNFGTVRLASRHGYPQMIFAIKSIPRKRVNKIEDLDSLEQELNILLMVDHPNIVKFYEVYLDHKYVHLVMEYVKGGELYNALAEVDSFDEETAKKIIK